MFFLVPELDNNDVFVIENKNDDEGKSLESMTHQVEQQKTVEQKTDRNNEVSKQAKKSDNNNHGVGKALEGLTVALENLQNQQLKQQKSKLINCQPIKLRSRDSSTTRTESVSSVTVSLHSSRRSSRASSPSSQTSGNLIGSYVLWFT